MTRFAPVALCLMASSGCLVGSLHPVYDADSILFDEHLLGTWEDPESEIGVTVSRGEWRSYQIAFTDRFGTTHYVGHLTGIGKKRLLNVLPEQGLDKPPFIVPTNGFLQVELHNERLRVREPDYAVMLERLRAGKLGVAAATDVKKNVLITASPARLRKWLAAALLDDRLWAEWKTFTRSQR